MTEDEMLLTVAEMNAEVEKHGYTYAQLERFTAVPAATIRRILTGETKKPRREMMLALSAVLRPFVFERTPDECEDAAQESHTLGDYLALPEERRAELIDGVFYDMAVPNERHQFISGMLGTALNTALRKKTGKCFAFMTPLDIQLDADDRTVVQPDIFIACDGGSFRNGRYIGAPILVVEILSASTKRKDALIKSRKYREAGVREYWMVNLRKEQVIVQFFERDEKYIYSMDDIVPLHTSDCEIFVDFAEIMRDLTAYFENR